MGRTMVPGQPGEELAKPHINRKKLCMVVHSCHPSNDGKCKIEDHDPGRTGKK
jgi:hypothetical protein